MIPTVTPVLPAAPLINPALVQSAEEAIGQNVLQAAQQAATSAPAATGGLWSGLRRPSWEETKSFVQGYTPSMATVKATPGNLWGGITSRAGSIYENRPKTMEEAGQMASALSGQAWSGIKATPGVMQTGLATYAGRPVISGASAVGSGASWLGSKLGSAWGSYAPKTVQQYAGQVGSGVGSGASWLRDTIGSGLSSAASYTPQTVQEYTGQAYNQAYNWLSNMTEEQKQAAVGLAAVIAAGLAAKKGYDYYRGPSAYDEFTQFIDNKVSFLLNEYAKRPDSIHLGMAIGDNIRTFDHMIKDELKAGALSEQEANNLLSFLDMKGKQLVKIGETYDTIKSFDAHYDHTKATSLYEEINKSPILTDEQKKMLLGHLHIRHRVYIKK
jgi:hypothetical protein